MGLRIYDPQYYHEISQRVNQGTFVIDPNDTVLRDALYGVLALGARRYRVQILAFHFLTNHYHGLYRIESSEQFTMFLAFVHAGFARAYHRLRNTSGKFWSYMTWNPVATDEASVYRRLRYIMGQALATGRVSHPDEFPGASSLDWMLHGKPLSGVRFDATQKCRDQARLRDGARPDDAYATPVGLEISPPEVWAQLDPTELRRRYWQIADELADEARLKREAVARDRAAGARREQQAPNTKAESQTGEPPAPPPFGVQHEGGRESERHAHDKVHMAMPTDENGDPHRAGKVKPKLASGAYGRPRRPKLLAADRAVVLAYEERYLACVEAYRAAKEQWRSKAKFNARRVLSVRIVLPPHMMVGTMPLRLAGSNPAGTLG